MPDWNTLVPIFGIALVIVPMVAYFWIATQRDRRFQMTMLDQLYREREITSQKNVSIENEIPRALAQIEFSLDTIRSFQARLEENRVNQVYEISQPMERLQNLMLSLNSELRSDFARSMKEFQDVSVHLLEALKALELETPETGLEIPSGTANNGHSDGKDMSTYRQVAAEFAHVIKTPLSAIETTIDDLNEQHLDLHPALQSSLNNASTAIESIQTVLSQGGGLFPGTPRRTSIRTVARKAVRMTAAAAQSGAEVTVSLDDLPDVKSDPAYLQVALIQILDNAFEATRPSGKIAISGEVSSTTKEVGILISNDGPPIEAGIRNQIFLPDVSTKGQGRGTGLALAKRCLAAINGNVKLVESDEERTVFRVSFTPEEMYST